MVPLDSVAGNTLIGMFTRLIFRKPFQVALAAMASFYRSNCEPAEGRRVPALRLVPLVMGSQVEAGAHEMDRVFADLVPQKASGFAVLVPGDHETACKI